MTSVRTDNAPARQKRPTPSRPNGQAKTPVHDLPERFSYRLEPHVVERRATGWFIAKSVPTSTGLKPEWHGPFKTIETAALAIARRNATEIADRHTRSIEHYGLDKSHKLYGLKPSTAL
jgi:hypothetical protein